MKSARSPSIFPAHPVVWTRALFVLVLTLVPAEAFAQHVGNNWSVSGGQSAYWDHSPAIAVRGAFLVATWIENSHTPQTAISRDGGATWQRATLPSAPDEYSSLELGSVSMDAGGTAYCAIVRRSPAGKVIAIFSASSDAAVWQWEQTTGGIALESIEQPEDVRIACGRDGVLYVAYTNLRSFDSRVRFSRSMDAGGSWSPAVTLSEGNLASTPHFAVGPQDELYVAWQDYARGAIVGRKSLDQGSSFGAEYSIGTIHDNLGVLPPGWSGLSRYPLLPHVYPTTPAFFGIAVDTTDGPHRGNVYAIWAEHAPGSADEDQAHVVHEAQGDRFYAEATPIELGDWFVGSMSSDQDSDCDRFVFDGTAGTTIHVIGSWSSCDYDYDDCHNDGGAELLCGEDTTRFVRIGVASAVSTPAFIFTLPVTGRYYFDLGCTISDPGGHRYTTNYGFRLGVYMPSPGEAARDHRDVVLVRSTDGGASWSAKVRVNDDPPGYDESLPAIAVDGSGRVHAVWYGRRDEPECAARVNTYWTWSDDGGQTFAVSRRLSEGSSVIATRDAYPTSPWTVGDYLALTADRDRVYAVWTHVNGTGDGEIVGVQLSDLPTSTTVSRFVAEASGGDVMLRWSMGGAHDVSGFRVHRAAGGDAAFQIVATLAFSGEREHSWLDREVATGRRYTYRLEVQRGASPSLWEGPVEVAATSPALLRWRTAAPNPFSKTVRLELESQSLATTRVRVFDVAGHHVVELHPTPVAGALEVVWNGRDRLGSPVRPGVYLIRADAGGKSVTHRLVRMP